MSFLEITVFVFILLSLVGLMGYFAYDIVTDYYNPKQYKLL
jgi:hypothetical protein